MAPTKWTLSDQLPTYINTKYIPTYITYLHPRCWLQRSRISVAAENILKKSADRRVSLLVAFWIQFLAPVQVISSIQFQRRNKNLSKTLSKRMATSSTSTSTNRPVMISSPQEPVWLKFEIDFRWVVVVVVPRKCCCRCCCRHCCSFCWFCFAECLPNNCVVATTTTIATTVEAFVTSTILLTSTATNIRQSKLQEVKIESNFSLEKLIARQSELIPVNGWECRFEFAILWWTKT